jgi:hypothetical protein
MAGINANLAGYEVQEGFSLLPPGEYDLQVVDSDAEDKGKGTVVKLVFEVIGKPGRLWDYFNLTNEVSCRRLKTLATYAGHRNPNHINDTEELHGLQVRAKIKIEKDDTGQYPDKNKISAYLPPATGQATTPTMPTAPGATATQSVSKAKMPWEKEKAA